MVIPSTCLPLVVSVAQTSERVSSFACTRAEDVHVFIMSYHTNHHLQTTTYHIIMVLLCMFSSYARCGCRLNIRLKIVSATCDEKTLFTVVDLIT